MGSINYLAFCTVHSRSSVLSINLSKIENLGTQIIEPGPLGEKRKLCLCAMRPPSLTMKLLALNWWWLPAYQSAWLDAFQKKAFHLETKHLIHLFFGHHHLQEEFASESSAHPFDQVLQFFCFHVEVWLGSSCDTARARNIIMKFKSWEVLGIFLLFYISVEEQHY